MVCDSRTNAHTAEENVTKNLVALPSPPRRFSCSRHQFRFLPFPLSSSFIHFYSHFQQRRESQRERERERERESYDGNRHQLLPTSRGGQTSAVLAKVGEKYPAMFRTNTHISLATPLPSSSVRRANGNGSPCRRHLWRPRVVVALSLSLDWQGDVVVRFWQS